MVAPVSFSDGLPPMQEISGPLNLEQRMYIAGSKLLIEEIHYIALQGFKFRAAGRALATKNMTSLLWQIYAFIDLPPMLDYFKKSLKTERLERVGDMYIIRTAEDGAKNKAIPNIQPWELFKKVYLARNLAQTIF